MALPPPRGLLRHLAARPACTLVTGSPWNVGLAPKCSLILLRINQSLFCKRLTLNRHWLSLKCNFPVPGIRGKAITSTR